MLFFLPYSTIVLLKTRYLANCDEAITMASASALPIPRQGWLPWIDPMVSLRHIAGRCIEQRPPQSAYLKIRYLQCNAMAAAASVSAPTVHAVSGLTDEFLLDVSWYLLRIYTIPQNLGFQQPDEPVAQSWATMNWLWVQTSLMLLESPAFF